MKRVLRAALSRLGVAVIASDDAKLVRNAKHELIPPGFENREGYHPLRKFGNEGYSLGLDRARQLIGEFAAPEYQALFNTIRQDPGINSGFEGVDYKQRGVVHNGFYPTPDAELYAAMILHFRPRQIVEIGSGYSTLIARQAVKHGKLDSIIRVIDPQPRRSVQEFATRVDLKRVEESGLSAADLPAGSLLFIDSSHICRRGGDLPFLFCQLLTSLQPGVLVHVHDVFMPYDYPDNYVERFYTEQYLLHALLANSSKFEVIFATHFMSRDHASEMQKAFGPEVGKNPYFNGASLWMMSR